MATEREKCVIAEKKQKRRRWFLMVCFGSRLGRSLYLWILYGNKKYTLIFTTFFQGYKHFIAERFLKLHAYFCKMKIQQNISD